MLALWLGLALLLAAAPRANAQAFETTWFPAGSICQAGARADEDYARIAAQPARWDCRADRESIAAPRVFLRFDLRGRGAAMPDLFSTRLTQFTAMRITALGADGRTASRDVAEADMRPATTGWLMQVALPRADRADAVVVRIEGARRPEMAADAALVAREDPSTSFRRELLIAMVCGLLVLPLVFNLPFYRILRERFLIWHSLATAFMLTHTLVATGLINRFFSPSLDALTLAWSVTAAGGIAAAALFTADVIEPEKLDPIHRRLLRAVALWAPLWTAFYVLASDPLRPHVGTVYYGSYIPVMALFGWVMVVAKRRRSRTVNFQIAAWLPLMLTSVLQIAAKLGAPALPVDMIVQQHFAIALEVMITTLGAMDRLMALRQQRDVAVAEARLLGDRAERDHLTGLFNRHALERRFPDMRAGGFHAMAVLDLDRFKDINDTFGHVKGDAVLRAVAEALAPDADTLAARMGGEEFLILLRGDDVAGRAERRRQAISARVAARVSGLDRVVTASMGMVELPPDGSLQNALGPLYVRCDQLLYEAKAAGRNRTMRERIQSFAARPPAVRAA